MAQERYFDWRGEAESSRLNARWYEALGNIVLNGLDVVPGSFGMKVTIQPGAGLVAGLTFTESHTQTDVLTLANGHHAYTRIDSVVAQYTRAEVKPGPPVTYLVVAGTPSSNPVPPGLATNQLRLANVLVPPGTMVLTSDMIVNSPKLRDRIQALVPNGVLTNRNQPLYLEGVIWKRNTDPSIDSTIRVEVGDIWCDTSQEPPAYYSWTGEEWVDIQAWDSIKNKPDTMPPQEHELAGDAHTGSLPISRVSGHTAFGPRAHQEAFALALLRRP